MKMYQAPQQTKSDKVEDPLVGYAAATTSACPIVPGVPDTVMLELLRQDNATKQKVIDLLAESMNAAPLETDAELREKELEEKRRYYQQKYNLPESMVKLIGIWPERTDEDWKQAKEGYLREKYEV